MTTQTKTIRDYVKERGITATTMWMGRDKLEDGYSAGHHEYTVELHLASPIKSLRATYHCNPLYHMTPEAIETSIPRQEKMATVGHGFHGLRYQHPHSGHTSVDQQAYNDLARAYAPKNFTVDTADVLDCLLSDASETDGTFEEWASNLGMDVDSRKAEKMFHACRESAAKLRRWLGAAEVERLMTEYERL